MTLLITHTTNPPNQLYLKLPFLPQPRIPHCRGTATPGTRTRTRVRTYLPLQLLAPFGSFFFFG
ncbi:hypothetical protein ES702_02476 [subsurface metagenome]